jgi:hypothetical protein
MFYCLIHLVIPRLYTVSLRELLHLIEGDNKLQLILEVQAKLGCFVLPACRTPNIC